MASLPFIPYFTLITLLISFAYSSDTETSPQTLLLSSDEQESAYQVLESVNSLIDWRSLFPDDLCYSGPHGLVCDYFVDENGNGSFHITELSFGYVSEYSSNPPCSFNATFSPSLTSFSYLKKLFFYKCFAGTEIWLPGYFSNLSSTLEELVFIENPSLFGTLNGKIGNLTSLRRLVLTGTNVSGNIPDEIGDLLDLEQITVTRNRLNGELPVSIGKLKKLKVLDLSLNGFEGDLPDSIGGITELLKLDLGSNRFSGKIPKSFVGLQRLEFLDLSWNRFGNYGVPLFLSEMQSLKEVYLSGNQLGGQIPEIWEKMGGILGLGLSGLGLVGKIPSSMGVFLRNVCFLGLDNNTLEGNVPEEFGLLESVHELNLENNKLSGRIRLPLSAKFGGKIKLKGNNGLCVDGEEFRGSDKNRADLRYRED
ncbi:Leucine-rich repeat [Macleaya cordata]|uniref:Leucine-rich repeat n=1 Tax=Macleaya cordata TaxID=56857 RepID=A0A200PVX0_MACCD|nr:Leucine-rich repeat [Macleaya cordata]